MRFYYWNASMIFAAIISLVYPTVFAFVFAFGVLSLTTAIVQGFSELVKGMQSVDGRLSKLEKNTEA